MLTATSFPRMAHMAYGYGLLLLLSLGVPLQTWGSSVTPPGTALSQERNALRASVPADNGQSAAPQLPFLDKRAYHTDAFSLSVVLDQRDAPAQECHTPACVQRRQAEFEKAIMLQIIKPIEPGAQDAGVFTSERLHALVEKTAYVGVVDAGMMLTMKQLPASFTKWTADRKTEPTPFRQWEKHISTAPVVDKDSISVNVSHAYSGSGYYTLCRNTAGYTGEAMQHKLECFLYSLLMSTFWEYGVEAFEEIPSIQDLIVTPVGGAILGEMFHLLQQKIEANGGMILGSKALGRFVIVFLNPLEEIVQLLQDVADPVAQTLDLRLNMTYGNILAEPLQTSVEPARENSMLQIQLTGKWPGKRADRKK